MHFPPLPLPSRRLEIPGFRLGHGSDTAGMTGLTVILCPDGARSGGVKDLKDFKDSKDAKPSSSSCPCSP